MAEPGGKQPEASFHLWFFELSVSVAPPARFSAQKCRIDDWVATASASLPFSQQKC